jgi:ankyrin repeat protein
MSNNMESACEEGPTTRIIELLDAGEDIECATALGVTPISLALRGGQFECAVLLVERGADLSKAGRDGETSLHMAVEGGSLGCIRLVLANTTIDINSTNNDGRPPIWCALNYDKLEVAKLLVENGANLFLEDYDDVSALEVSTEDDWDVVLGPEVLQHAETVRWKLSAALASGASTLLLLLFGSLPHILSPLFNGILRRIDLTWA